MPDDRELHVPVHSATSRDSTGAKPAASHLRHTFATRVLEQCGAERRAVARHFVALSTYLGHADIRNTYWYLQATPEMMTDIASAAEMLVGERAA